MGDIRSDYVKLVETRSKDYRWDLSPHAKDVMVSLLMTRDNIWRGGSFVDSVLSNNLGESVSRADGEIIKYLKEMVIARDYFYL